MCSKIAEYVIIDKTFTIGFVVIKRAYLLNWVWPSIPGINSCKFPNKCPIKNVIRNKPDKDAKAFLKIVDVK